MKKKVLSLALAFILALVPYAATPAVAAGYDWVIPPIYDYAYGFTGDDLAAVQLDGKWGYIDKTGKEVIPIGLPYDSVMPFEGDLARVYTYAYTNKHGTAVHYGGYIDKAGKEIVKPGKYGNGDAETSGVGGRFCVDWRAPYDIWGVMELGKGGYIDKTGKEIVPIGYNSMRYDSEDRFSAFGYSDGVNYTYIHVNKAGEVINYDFIWGYHDGVAWAERDGKYSLLDNTLKEIFVSHYDFVWNFSEGLATVQRDGKWGYIDKTGKEVSPFIYDNASSFSEGLAMVQRDGKWGYIDKTGKEVLPFIYDNASSFSEGLATVQLNGKWGFIDKNGSVVKSIDDNYWSVSGLINGIAYVWLDGKLGLIDKTGKVIVPPKYDGLGPSFNGVVHVTLGGKTIYINLATGKELPFDKYDGVLLYDEFNGYGELIRVYLDEKIRLVTGLVDKTGREIVPPGKYDDIWPYCDGLALVANGIQFGYIDINGKEIVPLGKYNEINFFSEGLAIVVNIEKNDVHYAFRRYGVIDITGNIIVPLKYDHIGDFSDGLAMVQLDSKNGYIDKTGKVVIPIIYDASFFPSDGIAPVKHEGKWGYIAIGESNPLDTADSWAHEHINEATNNGWLPADLQSNYKQSINRKEFVHLAMSWLRYHTGMTDAQLVAQYATFPNRTFADTTDSTILAAGKLDITAGSGGNFNPNGTFSRQDAAVMLVKVHSILNQMGGSFETGNPPVFGFTDMTDAALYAQNAINFVGVYNVMSGSGGKFNPRETFSRQHSITVFNNIDRRENK